MRLRQHKNYFNLMAVPQASLDFIEQTTFCSAARNAACDLLKPRYPCPPEVIYNFSSFIRKVFYKAGLYKEFFIRNFIKVVIIEIKMSNYDP